MDIAVNSTQHPSLIQEALRGSKTDQARQGIKLYVDRTNTELCPVAAVLTYLAVRGFDHGPLFKQNKGYHSLVPSWLTSSG